jgi:MFS family permease
MGFGVSQSYALSVLALLVAGAGMSWFAAMQSTLVLAHAPAERRSGIMGVLTTIIGLGQIGALQIGWLASKIGAPQAVLLTAACAAATLAVCGWRWPALWRPQARHDPVPAATR